MIVRVDLPPIGRGAQGNLQDQETGKIIFALLINR
jgi:hypothetical protein